MLVRVKKEMGSYMGRIIPVGTIGKIDSTKLSKDRKLNNIIVVRFQNAPEDCLDRILTQRELEECFDYIQ